MTAIFKRELKSCYTGLSGYVTAALMLVFAGIFLITLNFSYGYPNFEYVLDSMTILYIVLIPLLTMRLISEDRKRKTDQLLYSLPLTSGDIVLGKFLAVWASLGLSTAIMAIYPLLLGRFGTVNYATAYASLLAFFLMGGALLSVGLFLSALTDSQFIAGVLCFFAMLADFSAYSMSMYVSGASYLSFMLLVIGVLLIAAVVWYLTKNLAAALTFAVVIEGAMLACYLISPGLFSGIMTKFLQSICVFIQITGFINGVFDWKAIVYFLSVMAVFLFLTVQAVEKRRWS